MREVNPTYIEIYDDVLTVTECKLLIDWFEASPHVEGKVITEGRSMVDPSRKKSKEVTSTFSGNRQISQIIYSPIGYALEEYKKTYPSMDEYLSFWNLDDEYTFKKYETEEDGFKRWHCEQCKGGEGRMLVWMLYLNDAQSGTAFMNYPTVDAKMGRCLIWPASWTHIHRSELPNKGLKYIMSGWFSFK